MPSYFPFVLNHILRHREVKEQKKESFNKEFRENEINNGQRSNPNPGANVEKEKQTQRLKDIETYLLLIQ